MAVRENLEEWKRLPFESQAHMIAAMRDPQYRDPRNSAYREAVEARVLISSNTGASATVYSGLDAKNSDGGLGESGTTAAATRQEEEASAQQAFLEQYGPMSVSPAQRMKLTQTAPASATATEE
jgi:hypothetical protein